MRKAFRVDFYGHLKSLRGEIVPRSGPKGPKIPLLRVVGNIIPNGKPYGGGGLKFLKHYRARTVPPKVLTYGYVRILEFLKNNEL